MVRIPATRSSSLVSRWIVEEAENRRERMAWILGTRSSNPEFRQMGFRQRESQPPGSQVEFDRGFANLPANQAGRRLARQARSPVGAERATQIRQARRASQAFLCFRDEQSPQARSPTGQCRGFLARRASRGYRQNLRRAGWGTLPPRAAAAQIPASQAPPANRAYPQKIGRVFHLRRS